MSDCSTEAMKAKDFDLQKCVDCEHYCRECNTCCKGVPDHQDCMFRCWKPSRAYKAEQRYQQLEQKIKWCWMGIEAIHRHLEEYRRDISKEYEALQAWALSDTMLKTWEED